MGSMKLLSIYLATVSAAPNVVADFKIRNPDITPALGRGYSMTTYDVLSTCLAFTETTKATYNYDYDMFEYTSDGTATSKTSGSMQGSVSYGWVKGEISGSVSQESSRHKKTHYVATRMATERYYSSIDDTSASLTPDALALVQRGDLVGFFQACGSGYIRSIRRTAEIAAVIAFSSSSETTSASMAASLTVNAGPWGGGGVSAEHSSSSDSTDTSTRIKIKGFGLGLNDEGADTLVATNLDDYRKALKFAFKSMQSKEVGMIRGVEIVSWMNNLQFQNAVMFVRTEMIAWVPQDPDPTAPGHKVLVRGVEQGPLLTAASGTEGRDDYVPAVYAPQYVEAIEVKAITMVNAEFITSLEARYRKEMQTVSRFIVCKAELNSLKTLKLGKYKLMDHTKLDLNKESRDDAWTVDQAVTITSNVDNLNKRIDSLQVFIAHVYSKCASAITKHSNDGSMTKYWWDLPECLPTASGTPGNDDNPTLECIEGDKDFIYDKASDTVTCVEQPPPAAGATMASNTAGMNNFIDRYCLPEIDYSLDPLA